MAEPKKEEKHTTAWRIGAIWQIFLIKSKARHLQNTDWPSGLGPVDIKV
jgi:hypothetical protein